MTPLWIGMLRAYGPAPLLGYTVGMSFQKKIQNIRPSLRAIVLLFQEELSFKVLALCGTVTLVLSYFLEISRIEFLIVVLTIGTVLAVEALNTAIEELCDHVTPEEHFRIGKIKDIGSGASVLVLCAALVVGLVIFIPHLTALS